MAFNDSLVLSFGQHISEPCSIIMASVTGVLMICILIKTIVAKRYKGIMILLLLFLAARIATYGIRSHIGYNQTIGNPIDLNEEIVAGVLIFAAYLFFIEAVLDITSYWFLDLRDVHLSYNAILALYLSLYGILTVITAVGMVGQVKEIGSFDGAEIQLGKKLLAISSILFIAAVGFMIIFTILTAIIGPAPMRSQFTVEGIPCKPGVRPRLFASTFFLLFLQTCLLVEPIFHLWSMIDSTGFVQGNAAIALLVFLPESCATIAFLLVNFQEVVRPTLICCSSRKKKEVDSASLETASYVRKEFRRKSSLDVINL